MIRNYKEYSEFEDELISKEKPDIAKNFLIVEEMYKEAVALGAFSNRDPLEGIDVKIRIAKILNSVPKTNSKNS